MQPLKKFNDFKDLIPAYNYFIPSSFKNVLLL